MGRFNKVGYVLDQEDFKKSKRKIKKIIVHCSATPEGRHNDARDIHSWHLKRGWAGIGYHYVMLLSGEIQYGRNVNYSGAHAKGYNKYTIGVCLIGGTDQKLVAKENSFTGDQFVFLESFLIKLHKLYPDAEITGHRNLPGVNKACPCFDVKNKYGFIWKAKKWL